ncbi:ATP-binding cassette domain-containing protein [Alcaligenes nematophilus]
MGAYLLDVQNLHVCSEKHRLVKGVTFKLKEGEILAIVGESGSGKSLTSMACSGLLPPELTTMGEVFFDRQEILSIPASSWKGLRKNGIGVIFQDPMAALNPLMRISAQLAETLDGKATLSLAKKERILALLDEVGIRDKERILNAYSYELSGGQQQRIMIAMALASNPRLLIADEPTTALDASTQNQVTDLLLRLCHQRKMALLIVTHDLSIVEKMANHVAVFHDGQCVEQGSVHQVLNAPQHSYTQTLVAANKKQLDTGTMCRTQERASVLKVDQVSYRYPGACSQALNGVSLELMRGDCLGVVGESGSGKSTLAKLIVGSLLPDSGRIDVLGMPVQQRWSSDAENLHFARQCQYVFQDATSSLNPVLSIEQTLSEAVRLRRDAPSDVGLDVRRLMAEVELSAELLRRKPADLSGGQRQRVVIARALALNPDILVCDEPVSALDAHLQKQAVSLLIALQRQRALSLVFIGHDLAMMSQFCAQLAVMDAGRVVESGRTDQLLADPQSDALKTLIHHTWKDQETERASGFAQALCA